MRPAFFLEQNVSHPLKREDKRNENRLVDRVQRRRVDAARERSIIRSTRPTREACKGAQMSQYLELGDHELAARKEGEESEAYINSKEFNN